MVRVSGKVLFLSVAFAVGCGNPTPVSIPDTPDGAVEAVVGGLADHDPRYLWAALPSSYRADLTGLIHDFANAVDEEVYDESFRVVQKVVGLLKSKKSFLLNHPMASGMLEKEQASANWDSFVGLFETFCNSEFSSINALRQLDVEACLAETGTEFMHQLAAASKMSRDDPMADLEKATVELVKSKGNTAVVTVTVPDKPVERIELTKVEGMWIPSEMAEDWSEKIDKAKKGLAEMAKEKDKNTFEAKRALGMANMILDQFEKVETQKEFNELISGWFGGFGATPR